MLNIQVVIHTTHKCAHGNELARNGILFFSAFIDRCMLDHYTNSTMNSCEESLHKVGTILVLWYINILDNSEMIQDLEVVCTLAHMEYDVWYNFIQLSKL